MYLGNAKKNARFYDLRKLPLFAGSKLLYLPETSHLELEQQLKTAGPRLPPDLSLRLIALLAVRLDISAGPFTTEAGELVASHLGVLLNAEVDQPFLKIKYPSEPILATVAALTLRVTGWDRPLMTLCNYIDSSVVDAGFRGELLTKVVCLLAMDDLLDTLPSQKSPIPSPKSAPKLGARRRSRTSSASRTLPLSQRESSSEKLSALLEQKPPRTPFPSETDTPNYWRYAKPVKVSQFVDQLIIPPQGYQSFSAALISKREDLKVHEDKLHQFLNGWVFFNHFIKMEMRISIPLMARAWNRGVALICDSCTHTFDFVIPVMLAQPGDQTNLGPMFDDWNNEQLDEGCRWMSFILINSRNYHDAKNHDTAAFSIAPTTTNFMEKWRFDKFQHIYLSVLQEFGPEGAPGKVKILSPVHGPEKRAQIAVVLNGHGGETYKCLTDLPSVDRQFQRRKLTQEAIKQLKQRVDFEEREDKKDDIERIALHEGFFGTTKTEERWREHWKVAEENMQAAEQSNDAEMPDVRGTSILPQEEDSDDELEEESDEELEEDSDEGDPMDME